MTGLEIHQELARIVKGLECSGIELYAPESWSFNFQGAFGLNVQCPWRIVNEFGIAITGADHEQQFGLPAPVDAAARAMKLLSGNRLIRIIVSEKTGDLRLEFESDIQLEIFNDSSGYEGWNCGTPSGLQVIGMGGGGTGNFAPKQILS